MDIPFSVDKNLSISGTKTIKQYILQPIYKSSSFLTIIFNWNHNPSNIIKQKQKVHNINNNLNTQCL